MQAQAVVFDQESGEVERLFSCLLTAYGGWAFDLVVLLIPIIATAVTVARSGRMALVVCGSSAFLAVSLVAFAMHQAQQQDARFRISTLADFEGMEVASTPAAAGDACTHDRVPGRASH